MNLVEQLESILNTEERPLASLAVAIFKRGVLVGEAYLGHAHIAQSATQQNRPVDAKTKFRVASISKLVTTLGVMQLVEQGKLELDTDVGDRLGFCLRNPHFPKVPITLRLLLSHTSSIRDGDEQYSLPIPYTVCDFFEPDGAFYAGGHHWAPSTEPPGEFFCYCNLNYGLAGTLIEVASGQRFDQYMRANLFRPLGLDASFNIRDFSDESLNNIATLYRRQNLAGRIDANGSWVAQVDDYQGKRPDSVIRIENPATSTNIQNQLTLDDYQLGTNGTLFSPQGGLRISARALASIGMLIANGGEYNGTRILQPRSMEVMLRTQWQLAPKGDNGNPYGGLMRAWGIGLQRITNHGTSGDGDRLFENASGNYVGHAGDAYGLHSGLWLDPDRAMGFVYIIGGTGAAPEAWPGSYSSFYRWEEEIMTAIYHTHLQEET